MIFLDLKEVLTCFPKEHALQDISFDKVSLGCSKIDFWFAIFTKRFVLTCPKYLCHIVHSSFVENKHNLESLSKSLVQKT